MGKSIVNPDRCLNHGDEAYTVSQIEGIYNRGRHSEARA